MNSLRIALESVLWQFVRCCGYLTCSLRSREYTEVIFEPVWYPEIIFWSKKRSDDLFWYLILTLEGGVEAPKTWEKVLIFTNVGPSDAARKFSVGRKTMLWVCKTFSKIRGIQRTSNHVHPTHQSEDICGYNILPPPTAGFQITALI